MCDDVGNRPIMTIAQFMHVDGVVESGAEGASAMTRKEHEEMFERELSEEEAWFEDAKAVAASRAFRKRAVKAMREAVAAFEMMPPSVIPGRNTSDRGDLVVALSALSHLVGARCEYIGGMPRPVGLPSWETVYTRYLAVATREGHKR